MRFADALVPTLDAADVARAHTELARGRQLVCSAFAPWRADPSALAVTGLGGFTALRLEERLLIPPGGGCPNHLVLLYWEPADGDGLPEVRQHREEVAELRARLGDEASPRFHAVSYAALLRDWEASRPGHVAALRARYDVPAGPG